MTVFSKTFCRLIHKEKKTAARRCGFARNLRELNKLIADRLKYRAFITTQRTSAVIICHLVSGDGKASLETLFWSYLLFRFNAFSCPLVRAESHKIVPDDI